LAIACVVSAGKAQTTPPAKAATKTAAAPAKPAAKTAAAPLLDLNSAPKDQLGELPASETPIPRK